MVNGSKGTDNDAEVIEALELARQGTLDLVPLMGLADRLVAAGRRGEAIAIYQVWIERSIHPFTYVACFNCGVLASAEGQPELAELMYRNALTLNADLVQARMNLANCLEQRGVAEEALAQWRIALAFEGMELPENRSLQLHALNNLGRLLETEKKYQDSLAALEESFAIDPTQKDVLLHLVHLRQKMCYWPIYNPPEGITRQEMINGTSPLASVAAFDDPPLQLSIAKRFVAHKYSLETGNLASPVGYGHDRIRVGYLSSDFCLHAVSLLTVQLFELHDHEQFEIYGFCWSREDGTPLRRRVISAMDQFISIGQMGDREAAECIRSHEIDILIDLQGLTSGARPQILSYRPAPVQITYLGFTGTTGLPWIDYVISDKYLIPEELAPHFMEKPLWMPNCFQVSDVKRESATAPTRQENGLPEEGFIFCAFNNNYKYTPEMFAVWMNIIKRVPGSVLWILADNEWAEENLIAAATGHGVESNRLVFAVRAAPPYYLARYLIADLFLDTFPFNGGTTANDALWMGLPLLTCSGKTFASRMAGSLLANLGLPELITSSFADYEERAVQLATNPGQIEILKKKLQLNKITSPVFDIPRFVRDLEGTYRNLAKETARDGEAFLDRQQIALAGFDGLDNKAEKVTPVKQLRQKDVALVAVVQNRGPWIVEWLAFHLQVGFSRFYLYTHQCSDETTEILLRLASRYSITVHEIGVHERPHAVCYQHAYNSYGGLVDWMAFVEEHEFLFSPSDRLIGDALSRFEEQSLSALATYSVCYGGGGHLQEPDGLILENYQRHSGSDFVPNRQVRSIVRGRQEGIVTTDSRIFTTPHGTYDERNRPVDGGLMAQMEPSCASLRVNRYLQGYDHFCGRNNIVSDADNAVVDGRYARFDRNELDDGVMYHYLLPLKLKVRELRSVLASSPGSR